MDIREFKFLPLTATRSDTCWQETVLFEGTLRENIAYGPEGRNRRTILEAAKLANADEFVSRMPHGYDTIVGERGETLYGLANGSA